jgi:hypothetical protein
MHCLAAAAMGNSAMAAEFSTTNDFSGESSLCGESSATSFGSGADADGFRDGVWFEI